MNCISLLPRLGALAAGMLLAATAAAQNKPAPPNAAAAATNAPAVAEAADRLIKEVSAYGRTCRGYYSGLGGIGAGLAIGATMAALPAAAAAISVAGNPYYYANGVY